MKPIVCVILLIVVCGGVSVVNAADAPVAVDDDSCACFWEDGMYISEWGPDLLANDFDPAGLPLGAELVSGPSHGTLSYFNSDGGFVYVPDMYFLGEDSFTYRVWNGLQYSEPACVTMPVWAWAFSYSIPQTGMDAYTATVDSMLSVPAPGIFENDRFDMCPNFGSCSFHFWPVLIEEPRHGSLSLKGDGSFTYTPDPGFIGTDFFRYVAECDPPDGGSGRCFSEYTPVQIIVRDAVPPVPEFPGHVLFVPGIILGLFGIAVRMGRRR